MDLSELIAQSQAGSKPAVELLISQTYNDVYAFVFWKVNDANLAWDIAQSTYLRAWQRLSQYDASKGRFLSWLLKLANNVMIDHFRAQASRPATLAAEPHDPNMRCAEADVSDIVLRREGMAELKRHLDRLPSEQREAILLKAIYGMTFREIGEIMRVPESTAQSRTRLGIIKLKKWLVKEGEASGRSSG